MLTLHWWKCVFLWYIRIRERVSFKNKFFLQGGEQCPDSTTGNTVPECWVCSPVPLYSVAVVAVCLISLFCLAGVHYKKDVSKASTITGVPVLVGEQAHQRCSLGVQADGSSAAHQHPPFVLGFSRLHLLYPQSTAHRASSLSVWRSKGLRYLQLMLLCRHMLMFATQLVHIHSLRRQRRAESQASSSHR